MGSNQGTQVFSRGFLALLALLALIGFVAACGGDEDPGSDSTNTEAEVPDQGCAEAESVEVLPGGNHEDRDFLASDYETNPPTGGDHNPTPLDFGNFYSDPPRLGEAVHALEHGAVIGWTRDLSETDRTEVEDAFNEVFLDGYPALLVVENPSLDVPFALSSWGALQKCGGVDTEVIRPFIEANYASDKTAEGQIACIDATAPGCPGKQP